MSLIVTIRLSCCSLACTHLAVWWRGKMVYPGVLGQDGNSAIVLSVASRHAPLSALLVPLTGNSNCFQRSFGVQYHQDGAQLSEQFNRCHWSKVKALAIVVVQNANAQSFRDVVWQLSSVSLLCHRYSLSHLPKLHGKSAPFLEQTMEANSTDCLHSNTQPVQNCKA